MPTDPLVDVGRGFGRLVAHRRNAHLRLILLRVVDDLQAVLSGLVNGQGRSVRSFRVEIIAPLPMIIAVAMDKPHVIDRTGSVISFPIHDTAKALPGFVENILVAFLAGSKAVGCGWVASTMCFALADARG